MATEIHEIGTWYALGQEQSKDRRQQAERGEVEHVAQNKGTQPLEHTK
jgi:hypothetical protein